MPNHVIQIINFNSEEDLKKFLGKYVSNVEETINKNIFDYNWFLPEPRTKEECIKKYGEDFVILDKEKDHMDHDEREWFNWYNWRNYFWGSKWNAYDIYYNTTSIEWQSAWCPVIPVIEKIVSQNPELEFKYIYSEEQMSIYNGCIEADGTGQFYLEEYEPDSKEAWDTAFELWGGRECYFWNEKEGTYEYIEEGYNGFYDNNGEWIPFSFDNAELEACKYMYKLYGKIFADCLVESKEDEDNELLNNVLGKDWKKRLYDREEED